MCKGLRIVIVFLSVLRLFKGRFGYIVRNTNLMVLNLTSSHQGGSDWKSSNSKSCLSAGSEHFGCFFKSLEPCYLRPSLRELFSDTLGKSERLDCHLKLQNCHQTTSTHQKPPKNHPLHFLSRTISLCPPGLGTERMHRRGGLLLVAGVAFVGPALYCDLASSETQLGGTGSTDGLQLVALGARKATERRATTVSKSRRSRG